MSHSFAIIFNPGKLAAPFLVGAMAGCPLLAITCAQTVYYYRTYQSDHMLLKLLVLLLLLLEATHTGLLLQAVYLVYVVGKMPENILKSISIPTAFSISVTVTAVVTIIVQSFYAWRVHTLSKRHKWGKLIVYLILAMSLLEFGCGLVTNVLLYHNPNAYSTKGKLQRKIYSATLVATIVCDLTISLAQVYFLNKLRSGFRSSENVINRLIIFSINVGLLTSAIALCTLVAYYATPATSILYAVFAEINGKFYVNSMLVTLNSRKSNQEILLRSRSMPIPGLSTTFEINSSTSAMTASDAAEG